MNMMVTVLRTDGTTEEHQITARGARARLAACLKLIGAELSDTVDLRNGQIMIVDDNGYETRQEMANGHVKLIPTRAKKPVNVEATRLYHGVCKPGTTHQ